jgi:cyclophilin family peptidyl-prolyl cis-trans isomerase
MAAIGALARPDNLDINLDQLSHRLPAVRADANRALARVDPDAFIATLASLDADPDWRVRAAQAQALGTVPAERARPRLVAMLGDGEVRVIPAVLAAIAAAGLGDGELLARERLSADDYAVRAAAAGALADMKAGASVPALVAAYRAARGESAYTARAAILSAIHRLEPPAARPLLVESLQDRDWAVRIRAAALLREQGVEPSAAQPMRPATPGRPVDDPEWRRIVFPPYSPRAYIETSQGTIELELGVVDTPLTTHNFVTLARKGFFDNAPIHRIVPDFVVQDGDPRGDGEGGPGYTIRDELSPEPYLRGTLGMALDWEDTGGSQFFITHSPQPHLDARYTVFGRVVSGMEVVDRLAPSDVIREVRIRDGVTP